MLDPGGGGGGGNAIYMMDIEQSKTYLWVQRGITSSKYMIYQGGALLHIFLGIKI